MLCIECKLNSYILWVTQSIFYKSFMLDIANWSIECKPNSYFKTFIYLRKYFFKWTWKILGTKQFFNFIPLNDSNINYNQWRNAESWKMTFGFSKASGWEGGTKLKARRKGCLFSLSEVESEKRFVRDTLIPSHYSKSFVFFYYYR